MTCCKYTMPSDYLHFPGQGTVWKMSPRVKHEVVDSWKDIIEVWCHSIVQAIDVQSSINKNCPSLYGGYISDFLNNIILVTVNQKFFLFLNYILCAIKTSRIIKIWKQNIRGLLQAALTPPISKNNYASYRDCEHWYSLLLNSILLKPAALHLVPLVLQWFWGLFPIHKVRFHSFDHQTGHL